MPRKSKSEREAEALALAIEAAIASMPFSPLHAPDAPELFRAQPDAVQAGIVRELFLDFRVRKIGGKGCRAKYAGTNDAVDGTEAGLSGHRRRDLFREFGYPQGVAPSYAQFLDGDPRKGSAHAREHGEQARERQAEALAALQAIEAEAERKARRSEAARKAAATRRRNAEAEVRAEADAVAHGDPSTDAPDA